MTRDVAQGDEPDPVWQCYLLIAGHAFDRQEEPVRVVALCDKGRHIHAVKCILALGRGTTSSRVIVFDHGGRIVSVEPGRNEDRETKQVADFRKLALPCEFK